MQLSISEFDIKMAILDMLSKTKQANKFNMLGRGGRGDLENHLKVSFTDREKAIAGMAFEQLKMDGLIGPTYKDIIDPENWLEITDAGRKAFNRRALDDLDEALRKIDPALCKLRHGAISASLSTQPDSIRQAAHSARELINQVLHILAPLDDIKQQPGFKLSKEASRSQGDVVSSAS